MDAGVRLACCSKQGDQKDLEVQKASEVVVMIVIGGRKMLTS
jgi:hypothetical protein